MAQATIEINMSVEKEEVVYPLKTIDLLKLDNEDKSNVIFLRMVDVENYSLEGEFKSAEIHKEVSELYDNYLRDIDLHTEADYASYILRINNIISKAKKIKYEINHINTELKLNGVALQSDQYINYAAFLIKSKNTKPFYLPENIKAKSRSGFYPLTCSCGDAGCDGIYNGVHSKHKLNKVKWIVTDPVTQKRLGGKYFSFDKEQYESEVSKIWQWLHQNKDLFYQDNVNFKLTSIAEDLEYWKKEYPEMYEKEIV